MIKNFCAETPKRIPQVKATTLFVAFFMSTHRDNWGLLFCGGKNA
jgi:hypothetical protein